LYFRNVLFILASISLIQWIIADIDY
jgi:hypothetical protein